MGICNNIYSQRTVYSSIFCLIKPFCNRESEWQVLAILTDQQKRNTSHNNLRKVSLRRTVLGLHLISVNCEQNDDDDNKQ